MKVVLTGSIAFDYLMTFPGKFREHLLPDQLDNISVSFLVDSMRRFRGGVAPNIAYTNALLGGAPKIMAAAGKDFNEYGEWLLSRGVDTSGIVVFDDVFCASFFVTTDEKQNQIAAFYEGAMAKAAQLTFSKYGADSDLAVISPNNPAAMKAYVTECKESSIQYIYDPSQQIIRLGSDDLMNGIDGCFLLAVNEYELSMIEEKTGLSRSTVIAKAGALVMTRGELGAEIYIDDSCIVIPPVPPRKIADPTGAGDAFRGGLIRGIQLGFPWSISGRMGALASTYVLENVGTQSHNYTRAEFVDRYRENFDDEGILDTLLS
jgi:adenosine kinase